MIDSNGVLSLFDILRREKLPVERREVWDLKWSEVSLCACHTSVGWLTFALTGQP